MSNANSNKAAIGQRKRAFNSERRGPPLEYQNTSSFVLQTHKSIVFQGSLSNLSYFTWNLLTRSQKKHGKQLLHYEMKIMASKKF